MIVAPSYALVVSFRGEGPKHVVGPFPSHAAAHAARLHWLKPGEGWSAEVLMVESDLPGGMRF